MVPALMSWVLAVWVVVTCLSVAVPVWKRAGLPSGPSRRSLLAGLMEAASLAGLMRLVVPWTPGAVVLWVMAVVVLAAAVAGAVLRWPVLPGRGSKSEAPVRETASGTSTGPADAELEGSALVPKPDDAVSEVSDQSRRPQAATVGTSAVGAATAETAAVGTATAETAAGPGAVGPGAVGPGAAGRGAAMEAAPGERPRRPFLHVRERAAAPDTGKSDPASPDTGKPGGKAAAGKPGGKAAAGKKMKKEPGNLALAGNAALLVAVVVISFLAG